MNATSRSSSSVPAESASPKPFHRPEIQYKPAEPCGFSQTSIEEIGEYVAAELGYEPGQELESIVGILGGEIRYVSFPEYEETNTSGSILVHGRTDFTIVLPNFTSELRNRFSIAHELGHYFLHSGQGTTPIYAERYGRSRQESEANWFAAGFLMPADAFAKSEAQFGLNETAYRFGVSMEAAIFRSDVLRARQP